VPGPLTWSGGAPDGHDRGLVTVPGGQPRSRAGTPGGYPKPVGASARRPGTVYGSSTSPVARPGGTHVDDLPTFFTGANIESSGSLTGHILGNSVEAPPDEKARSRKAMIILLVVVLLLILGGLATAIFARGNMTDMFGGMFG